MKKHFAALILILFVFSCAEEPKYPDIDGDLRTVETTPKSPGVSMQFDCSSVGRLVDSTATKTLYFLYADNKVAIDNIPVCGSVPRSQWGDFGIPSTAFIVSGGKWASGSAYFYVEQNGDNLIVSKIASDELDGETGAPKEIYRVKIRAH